jgi:hypothetical protein
LAFRAAQAFYVKPIWPQETLVTFGGRLTSWWTKIVIGALLFCFIPVSASILKSVGLNSE